LNVLRNLRRENLPSDLLVNLSNPRSRINFANFEKNTLLQEKGRRKTNKSGEILNYLFFYQLQKFSQIYWEIIHQFSPSFGFPLRRFLNLLNSFFNFSVRESEFHFFLWVRNNFSALFDVVVFFRFEVSKQSGHYWWWTSFKLRILVLNCLNSQNSFLIFDFLLWDIFS